MKAWTVHFINNHPKQSKQYEVYKSKLGSEKVPNQTKIVDHTVIDQLLRENKQLKTKLNTILKIRCAARSKKKSVKQLNRTTQLKL